MGDNTLISVRCEVFKKYFWSFYQWSWDWRVLDVIHVNPLLTMKCFVFVNVAQLTHNVHFNFKHVCTHSLGLFVHTPGWSGGIGTHSLIILWQGLRAIARYIWFRHVHYVLVLQGNTFSQIFFPYITANLINTVWNLCATLMNYNSPNNHRTFDAIFFIERAEWVMQICTHMYHKYLHACILFCILDSALAEGTFILKIRERMTS